MKQFILTIACAAILGTGYAQTIEDKIGISLGQAFQNGIEAFEQTDQEIATIENEHEQAYWQAFSDFYKAVYFLQTDREKSREVNNKALQAFKPVVKNSEDYALLAYMHSFQMQFLTKAELSTADSQFYTYIEKAKKLDAKNPRVYLVLGYYDMYKPVEYGGGTKYKSIFAQAKKLFETEDNALPNWGQRDLANATEK